MIDAEVKTLLALKADYKKATGKDWAPGAAPAAAAPPQATATTGGAGGGAVESLFNKVAEQGNKIREMKARKAAKVRLNTIHPG